MAAVISATAVMARSGVDKKLLMVDYFFPPSGGSGVRRTLGWIKYLCEYGWSPLVLTVRGGDAPFDDPTLNNFVPANIFVCRTPSIEPVRFAKRVLRRRVTNISQEAGTIKATYHFDWLRRLIPWIHFPDRRMGWVAPAIAAGVSVLRSHPIDAIYSTYSDTIGAHFVAYALKAISGKPWVADFQDPWSEPYISAFPSPLHRSIARRIEQALFKKADHVIVTTSAVKEVYAQKYPSVASGNVSVIPNGFDPESFQVRQPASRRLSFRIVHFGVFWGSRSPAPFLKGLAQAIKMSSRLAAQIEVKFLGGFEPKHRDMTRQLLMAYGLDRTVDLVDSVPYTDGVNILLDSDVLLLVLDNTGFGQHLAPCKLFDYLAARKPILALVPNGETARIIQEANAGVVVNPEDAGQIAHALVQIYDGWREGLRRFAINEAYVDQFSYRETTKSFASILNQVVTEPTDCSLGLSER